MTYCLPRCHTRETGDNPIMPPTPRRAARALPRTRTGADESPEKFGSAPKKGEKRVSFAAHRPGMAEASAFVDRLATTAKRQVRFEDGGAEPSSRSRPARQKG
jgi:hypothetical protein